MRTETLLMLGIHNNDAGCVKKMLERGADANGIAENKPMIYHAMDCVGLYYDQECQCQLENYECESCITKRAEFEKSDILQIFQHLLKNGANPNVRAYGEETLLISVINIIANFRNKYIKIAELLLQYGCDANGRSESVEFTTPLISATIQENIRMVQLLLQNGADVEGVDSDGRTAMHFATEIDTPVGMKIMEVLLKNGVDLEKKYFNNFYRVEETLLHHVVSTEYYDGKIEQLLKYGGDINEISSDKQTAMMLCSSKTHLQTLIVLTKHIAKMRLCLLPVNSSNMRIINNHAGLKECFQTACDNYSKMPEMEELKQEVVYGTITLYRVLSNDLKQVVPFLRNKDVVIYFESAKFEKFPVFGSYIKAKYRQALKMKYLRDLGEEFLLRNWGDNFKSPTVAMAVMEQAISYLKMDDLLVFGELAELPDEEYNISEKDINEMKSRCKRQRCF